jgi:enoyl-CoA hydratase/carnithine racemase
MSVQEPEVLVERTGRVAVIRLNRPQARNALNGPLLEKLQAALRATASDPEVGSVVLTGQGSAFCAGADLKETASGMAGDDFWSQHDRATQSMTMHGLLTGSPKPVIAAVNGPALAGGCAVAMSCDLVLASDQARFGYPEVNRGLVAAMAMVTLSRIVPRRQALDLLLTGRTFDANEALALGMVNRVIPHAELLDAALGLATEIAAKSAGALRITKELYNQVLEVDAARAMEHARDVNQMVKSIPDARSGAAAFGSVSQR